MNTRRRSRAARVRTHSSRRRAYTLVEVVTAVVLGSLLIAGTLRWAASVTQVVASSVRSGDNGQILLALSRMGDDVDGAVHCDASGRDALLRDLSDTSFRVVTDPDGDGTAQMVTWRITLDGTVQRAAVALDANCGAPAPSAWSTIAEGVDPAGSWFRPVVAGVQSVADGDYLSCTDLSVPGCVQPTFTAHIFRSGYEEVAEATFHIAVR